MGTRAVLTFKDKYDSFNVYQHYDGYPEYILPSIKDAKEFAWDLPRFEAADFAAAFIAANKQRGGGNVYMTTSVEAHGDLEYYYTISKEDNELKVEVYKADYIGPDLSEKIYSLENEVCV